MFDGEPVLGDSIQDANSSLRVLFGYWNTLVAQRTQRGDVHLAARELVEMPTKEELCAFAELRHREIQWFIRGIDAGGDDPIEFGPEGQRLLEGIAHGSGFLRGYIEVLERNTAVQPEELEKTRETLLELVATIERLISDLMRVSEQVRREALDTFAANEGAPTADGVRVASSVKIGRNAPCPCGSGKRQTV
jgi:hypothetical protein